jgi:hypothetical protein
MPKKCLLICYSDLAKDPRVLKHQKALIEAGFEVITAGVTPTGTESDFVSVHQFDFTEWLNNASKKNEFTKLTLSLFARVFNFYKYKIFKSHYFLRYWNARRVFDLLKLKKFGKLDLIIANDIETLPIAVSLASGKISVLYDAHEFHEEQYADKQFWVNYYKPLVVYLNKRYIPKANFSITVGENIALEFERLYKTRFEVILNSPPYANLKAAKAEENKIKIVHAGAYVSNRKIDDLIFMMDFLPDIYELHFLLTCGDEVLNKLKEKAKRFTNIFFHDAVEVYEVPAFLNKFDIGVALIPATTFNYDHAMPNKFFQYIQARLVTAFGPLKQITVFTEKHKTGVISEEFTAKSMAEAIKKLSTKEIDQIKENNEINAKEFCEENETLKLVNIYKQLTNK